MSTKTPIKTIKDSHALSLPEGWRVRYQHDINTTLTAKNKQKVSRHTTCYIYAPDGVDEHGKPLYRLVCSESASQSPKDDDNRKLGNHIALQRALRIALAP